MASSYHLTRFQGIALHLPGTSRDVRHRVRRVDEAVDPRQLLLHEAGEGAVGRPGLAEGVEDGRFGAPGAHSQALRAGKSHGKTMEKP